VRRSPSRCGWAGLYLHSAGCAALPLLIDPGWRAFYEERGWPLQRWLGYGIELGNAVIDAGRPATFGFHMCRGNQLSRWLVAGGYDTIAAPVFGGVHVDRLLLEYDDERSGTFDPLRLVPGDKVVVLGLVTTKTSQIEPLDQIRARLGEARSVVDAERRAEPSMRLRHLGRRQRHHRQGATRQTRPAHSRRPGLPARLNRNLNPARNAARPNAVAACDGTNQPRAEMNAPGRYEGS
jgi:hypothetical protein